jgi:serine/threonine protein kinase
MKFIVKHGKSEKDIRNLRQEIEILRQLKHENIIQMLDAFETKTDFCVVTGVCCCSSDSQHTSVCPSTAAPQRSCAALPVPV